MDSQGAMRLPAVLASYDRALTGVSVALLPTLLHATEPGKAVEDALKLLVLHNPCEKTR